MIMILKQKKIKFKPRIDLNQNIYIPALTSSLLVRPMQGNQSSGIQEIFAFGIRNTAQEIRNPTNYSNPESEFH